MRGVRTSPHGDGDAVQGPRWKLLPVVIGAVVPEVAVVWYCESRCS